MSHFFALKFSLRLAAHPAVLLLHIIDFYLDPHGFHTVLVGVAQREDVFLGVKWESEVVRADCDYCLSTVKCVVFVELDLLLPALIKLLLEAFLVVDHVHYALVDIPTVTRAAPESVII